MKYLVLSDIHGAFEPLSKVLEIYKNYDFDKVIFLGDVLYHGPRNDLPPSYAPKKCIELINNNFKDYIWIQGNCDSEVDEMVLKHKFVKSKIIKINGKNVLLSHGHHISRFDLYKGKRKVDVIIYGHYHVYDISSIDGITYINVGSTSIPKDSRFQYAIIDNSKISIFDLTTNECLGKYCF